MVRWGLRLEGRDWWGRSPAAAVGRRDENSARPRAALLDEPASAGGGAKERRAAPLSLACPKTLLWRFTRTLLHPALCMNDTAVTLLLHFGGF